MASTNFTTQPPRRHSYTDYEPVDSPNTTVSKIKIPLEMERDRDEDGEENVGPDYCKTNSNVRLWVTVSNGKNGCKSILQGLTGYARPGEILAATTLLDALAGRLASKSKQFGEILVYGRKQQLAFGILAFLIHDNVLTWTLTTREAMCYSAQLQLPNTTSKAEKLREMGLQSCIDTRIGGWGSKDLSTGQQRRVSICTEMLTRLKLLFLDEPTSGLDSAASYYVVNQIVELAREYGITALLSMHYTEVRKLLDNLCLPPSGRTIYFGPSSAVNQFFARNGFSCPDYQNPADHYLRIINTNFYKGNESAVEGKTTTKEVIDKLVESCASSDTYDLILREEQINVQQLRVLEKKRSSASFFVQCLVLTESSFMNMYRDLNYKWLCLATYITLAIGLGTVSYNVGNSYNSINARCSMIMFVVSLLALMTARGFPSFVEDIKVFGRERLNGHYGATAFPIINTVSSILFFILIAIIPGMIVIASHMFAASLLVKKI